MALDFANMQREGAVLASFVNFLMGGPLIQTLLEQRFGTKFVYLQFLQFIAKYRKVVRDALKAGQFIAFSLEKNQTPKCNSELSSIQYIFLPFLTHIQRG